MSSTPPPGGRLFVEPLEARIAPTGLTAIANNPASASAGNYVTYGTLPSTGHLGFVPASTYLGASAPANLYAIKLTGNGTLNSAGLSTGDELLIFNSTTGFNPNEPFLQATNQTLVAFFLDKTHSGNPLNDQVTADELVGISLTKKSGANVNGTVNGDIVTNLSKDGSTVSLTSVGRPGFAISGLTVSGNVTGNILGGGNINDVDVQGTVTNIFAGTATNGVHYNFTGTAGATTGVIAEGPFPAARPGASITGLTVASVTAGDFIHSGDGGVGAIGGDISNLLVLNQTVGFNVVAGNGGGGTSTIKGGAGGEISTVIIEGAPDTTNNALINLHAGTGGEDDAFKGGAGGSVFGVASSFNSDFNPTNVSSQSVGGTVSADLLTENILVQAGNGGVGFKGGTGGSVSSSSLFGAAPDDGMVTNGVANAEIQVIAGHGGLPISSTAGHGGKGGGISQVYAESLDTNADGLTTSILIQGGDGGSGRLGGTISGVNLLGAELVVNAGNGADGLTVGGAGGSLETITILNQSDLFAHQLTLNAGSGGAAQTGPGGAGGEINGVIVADSDLNLLVINGGTHANGGQAGNGVGGAGGQVTNVQLTDSDVSGAFATVTVRSGAGGNGLTGGGAGGDISQFQMFGLNFGSSATAGAGGSVLNGGSGAGGNGGGFNTVGFASTPTVSTIDVGQALTDALATNYAQQTSTAIAGAGGNGTDHGGAGGDLATVDLRASYDVTLTAGAGGAGGVSAGGVGGMITSSAGVSLGGAVLVVAGSGSNSGAFAADGGGISNVIASAQTNITMTAGNGGAGGNGGDIANSGTTPNPLYVDPSFTTGFEVDQTTSNFGNTTITAGSGSSANGTAGTGGSVTTFNGSIGLGGAGDLSSAGTHVTTITAGAGGGGSGQTASGAGGSVHSLQLTGNSLTDYFGGQILTIDAGNAGQSTAAKRGAAGGTVDTATIFNLDTGTSVQHIAAGDGSSGTRHGGDGGTINQVNVGRPGDLVADIGVRSGATFGYAIGTAGGLFAGVGGTGSKSTGTSGDVTNITANAISSIVAGKTNVIHLANTVDGIDLEGNTASTADATGAFTNFDTANIVGSVQNPTAAGASTYHAGDGLIAATNLTQNRDFTPEAFLTVVDGVLTFEDYQQPTVTPVVTTTIPFAASL